MKNSNDTIGNRTRDLPACSAVPQPNLPPRVRFLSNLINLGCTVLRNLFFSYVFQSLSSTLCFTMASRAEAVKEWFCAPQVRRSQRRRVIIQTYSQPQMFFSVHVASRHLQFISNTCIEFMKNKTCSPRSFLTIRDYGLFSNKRADEFNVPRSRRGCSDFRTENKQAIPEYIHPLGRP